MRKRKLLKMLFYLMIFQLFMNLPVHAADKVYVSGEPVGIYIRTHGLLVLAARGEAPSLHRLEAGDYICKANGKPVCSKKELQDFLQTNKDREIIFSILRKGAEQEIRVKPEFSKDSRSWQIGAWIRSDTQGIGTITFICPDKSFAALGHGINDYDLGVPMDISCGSIYQAQISSIMKGEAEYPGELIGSIDYRPENYLGSVNYNSDRGIFGRLNDLSLCSNQKLYSVAANNEVKKGKAILRTSINGKSRDYAIEIEKIYSNKKDRLKTLKIHVTDQELLSLTGGIIQGLSGSPILQDGKLVGAVTHVLVGDPTRGYGILAKDMIDMKK